ncbi:Alcohol dehydrogenase GroES-like protein [Cynara cardunculus var. scolymus]|uniref:Alcohol dehydrogenase GroES-like protein n=1 Tax=Cynara cardunculus var. scolymus TaxID=59895 RepID=A0A103XYH6_CYNCS|nr:Alcohol dehydrogenase GroES-like protein [Cynara cardunculus var. scolymus]
MANSPDTVHPIKAYGYGATDTSGTFSPLTFSRRVTGDKDVRFKVLYCGICHSDLHFAKNEWGVTTYPVVPGHEIVGVVTEVGSKVEKFKVGDTVGVGCLVGSCRSCQSCSNDLEQYCPKMILTYSVPYFDGTITYGGYSDHMVSDEHFVLRWPQNLPLDSGAPLLCAGITTYSPLRHYGLDKPGTKLGVVGLGGLGHVAVKMAKAFGAEVTAATGTLDGIIDTVSASHAIAAFLNVLKTDGKLVLVGRKIVGGSNIGGLKETQEMLDFSAKHGITADVEVVPIDYVNTAMDRLLKSDVRYRFVIDVANSLKAPLNEH